MSIDPLRAETLGLIGAGGPTGSGREPSAIGESLLMHILHEVKRARSRARQSLVQRSITPGIASRKNFTKKGLNCVVQVRGRNHSCREPGEYTLLDSEASPSFFDLLRPGMSPIGGGGGGRGIVPPTPPPPPSFLLGAAGITAADAATFSTLSHFLSFPEKCVEVRCSSVYTTEEENR